MKFFYSGGDQLPSHKGGPRYPLSFLLFHVIFFNTRLRPLFLLMISLLCIQAAVFAQSPVSGTVKSSEGEMLPGATVVVKGKTIIQQIMHITTQLELSNKF